jgi:hypothetical protein
MKKFATTFFIFSMIFCWVQISTAQCVQCDTSSQATGVNASVIGTNTLASGDESFAGGLNSIAEGDYSFAFGESSEAIGDYSVAMPFLSKALGNRSFALGYNSIANGMGSLAIGTHSHTGENAVLSIAIGSLVSTSANWAMVLGMGSGDSLLTNRKQSSFMVGFNSNRPTFFVSPSGGIGTTGKIGIGDVTSPEAKLHIRADDNENAIVKLEAYGTNKYAGIYFGDDNNRITGTAEGGLSFKTPNAAGNFKFINGKVGIGTLSAPSEELEVAGNIKTEGLVASGDIFIEDIDHGIVMKSPNGSCWRGTVTDEGQLQFTEVDCDDLMVSTPEPEPAQNTGIRIYPNPAGDRVFLEVAEDIDIANLLIHNSNGVEISRQSLNNSESFIDMTGFPPGVYFFKVTTSNGKVLASKKVIKQ